MRGALSSSFIKFVSIDEFLKELFAYVAGADLVFPRDHMERKWKLQAQHVKEGELRLIRSAAGLQPPKKKQRYLDEESGDESDSQILEDSPSPQKRSVKSGSKAPKAEPVRSSLLAATVVIERCDETHSSSRHIRSSSSPPVLDLSRPSTSKDISAKKPQLKEEPGSSGITKG